MQIRNNFCELNLIMLSNKIIRTTKIAGTCEAEGWSDIGYSF